MTQCCNDFGNCTQGRDCPIRKQRAKETDDAYIERGRWGTVDDPYSDVSLGEMMKTVIELAKQAGMNIVDDEFSTYGKFAKNFAALVEAAARADEREACAKACEDQIKIFLSPQYKTGQPLSSLGERHAAASCAEAIRARGTK